LNPAEVFFFFLPLPYWAIFVIGLYRHDLSRVFHPVRDDGSLRNWWLVLSYLGLLEAEQAAHRPGRSGEFLRYLGYLAVSIGASLSWVLGPFPPIWYYLIIFQIVSAIALAAASIRYLGLPARKPHADVLRYPRLGSRVRHLREVPFPNDNSLHPLGKK
jgi:hypothetical protein